MLALSNSVYSESLKYTELTNFIQQNCHNVFFNQGIVNDSVAGFSMEEKVQLYSKYAISFDEAENEAYLNLIPSLGSWIHGNYLMAAMIDFGMLTAGGEILCGYMINDSSLQTVGYITFGIMYMLNILGPFDSALSYNTRLANSLGLTPDYRGIHSIPKPASGNLLQFNLIQAQW